MTMEGYDMTLYMAVPMQWVALDPSEIPCTMYHVPYCMYVLLQRLLCLQAAHSTYLVPPDWNTNVIAVLHEDGVVIIDLQFHDKFASLGVEPHEAAGVDRLWDVPEVFVGSPESLMSSITSLSAMVHHCFKQDGRTLPPWRQLPVLTQLYQSCMTNPQPDTESTENRTPSSESYDQFPKVESDRPREASELSRALRVGTSQGDERAAKIHLLYSIIL
eukprot:NODE_242_length_2047_cov_69.741742_g208_i0.p1 GENE.NODE_242_length_2047_cov_69.741742_g208_i0~~NODE_242_length_2047_cov_69.741742_g208_i0.p1  ORF type:complete len:217 (-),score=27.28 NODE_242_length_2047_cov_69.741742_g208_i0:258-908(-)